MAIIEFKRDPNRSNSEFGQHIHDCLPRIMYWADIDGVIYKLTTRILRVVEQKQPGQGLKSSQKAILPILARAIEWQVEMGELHPQSGVFVVHCQSPFERISVQRVSAPASPVELTGDALFNFLTGQECKEAP